MRLKLKMFSMVMLAIGFTQTVSASNELLNEQLVRIINQLNAIKPIIKEAERIQSEDAPVKLHLSAFKGSDGRMHNGVGEDIELIRKGLIAYLNKPVIAPQKVLPVEGDFIEAPKKGESHE